VLYTDLWRTTGQIEHSHGGPLAPSLSAGEHGSQGVGDAVRDLQHSAERWGDLNAVRDLQHSAERWGIGMLYVICSTAQKGGGKWNAVCYLWHSAGAWGE